MLERLRSAALFLTLSALLFLGFAFPAFAQPAGNGQAAIDAYRDAREAVTDAINSGDPEAADEAREKFDKAEAEYREGVESGEIGEYLEEGLFNALDNVGADLRRLELRHFQIVGPLGEGFFGPNWTDPEDEEDAEDPEEPETHVEVGTEYDAAETFRPRGNPNRGYRVLPPGAYLPATNPAQDAAIAVGGVLDAVPVRQPQPDDEPHVAPAPKPSKPRNPCGYQD